MAVVLVVVAFGVAQLGADLPRVSTGVVAVGAQLGLALRPSLAAVSGEHVLVVLAECVVVEEVGGVLACLGGGHDDGKELKRIWEEKMDGGGECC